MEKHRFSRNPDLKSHPSYGPAKNAYRKNEASSDTIGTQRQWEPSDASSILDGAIERGSERTLDDWCNRIKSIGRDVPIDEFAEMLFDTPDDSMSRKNKSTISDQSTFEPLGYSIIDRDEQSYQARNLKRNDITVEGIEPSNVSWGIPPNDSISLFRSRLLTDTTNRCANRLTVQEENEESLLYKTTDLMDQLKDFPYDVSGCDMADMLLPPPNRKSTKERLWSDGSSVVSDVPSISEINHLIKTGLSPEELINELLGLHKMSSNTSPKQLEARKSPLPTLDRPSSPGPTLQWRKENIPEIDRLRPTESKINHTNTNTSDESFVPMSYSIIDRDEESILKKYQLANDITLPGIENSNISWQLNPNDISLFKEHGKSMSTNMSNLRPIGENALLEEPMAPPTRLRRSPRANSSRSHV